MKKLALAAAVSVLMAGQAYADGDIAPVSPVDFELEAEVESLCVLASLDTLADDGMDFGQPANGKVQTANIEVFCNDPDGATVTLTSSMGALRNNDDLDLYIPYTATVNLNGEGPELVANQAAYGDKSESAPLTASVDLASGVQGTVTVRLDGDAIYSGEYTDQLMVQIAANL